MEQIKIKYHTDKIDKIEKIKIGDWIDLRASEDVVINKGEFALIPLGVSMTASKEYSSSV